MHEFEHERLIESLNDPKMLAEYKEHCDNHRPGLVVRLLAGLLIGSGNLFYGRAPSYGKFRALEVIARIPYQSWEVASYTFLTALYTDERKAIELTETSAFSRVAQDNETMHVVVVSQLAKRAGQRSFILYSLIPILFAFFYFWAIFILYLVRPRAALELNYLFENHAFDQYDRFLELKGEELKHKMVMSDFLTFYGRNVRSEYEFFRSVRNDEIVHRNKSLRRAREIREAKEAKRAA